MAIRSKTIDNKTLNKLRAICFHIKYETISEQTGLSLHTVGNAVRTGIATENTIEKLTHFIQEYKQPA